MVRGIPNITVPTINYTMAQGGKMSLPVDPASLIYSHFQYVSGVPAPSGTQGVAISKLNLLDVLIGQLNQIKRGPSSANSAVFSEHANAGNNGIDGLIDAYRNQIKQARAASAAMPYIHSPSAQSGAVFSIIA